MKRIRLFAALVLCLSLVACLRAEEGTITVKDLTVRFDPQTRTVAVSHKDAGSILERICVTCPGDKGVRSDDKGLNARVGVNPGGDELTVAFENAFAMKFALKDNEVQARVEGSLKDPPVLTALAALGEDAMLAMLKEQAAGDRGVLVTSLGQRGVAGACSLFDPRKDLAVTAGPPGRAEWRRSERSWMLRSSAPAGETILSLKVRPHYYRDELGIRFYAPIPKLPRWPTAPVVAMTWYGIEGWKNRPAQTMQWLAPQIDWVAKHLLPYAGANLVFQLDDNYSFNDDKVMRELSDYIRSRGLVPGIWFTPFTVAPKSEAEKHPAWFLHDKNGKLIPTFGGMNWGGNFTLNAANPQAVEAWYGMWWKKAGETWNFDFFKIDGEPEVANAYRRSADGGGDEGYRKALRIGRSVVGPEKFINGCWGTPVEGIGIMNGSRIGSDTGNDPHAINVILEWNFLNNVAWYCDPDAAANLFRATVERTRLNAQARVLTGQQFLTDDVWTKVPPEVCRVWQLSFPMLDIRPVNLYPIRDPKKYDLFDLKVSKPWGFWDVVGVFNYDARPAEKVLDLGRLSLEAEEVHVFDFWQSAYLGRFPRTAKIPLSLAAFEGKVCSVVPAQGDRPVLVSTSRHVSQGALDLEQVEWKEDGRRWTAAGRSSHLVKGDPYELVFASGRSAVTQARSSAGKTSVRRSGGVVRVAVVPEDSSEAQWEVTFEPSTQALLDLVPPAVDLVSGASAQIELQNLSDKPGRFKITSSDPRVRAVPEEGEVGPWPAKVKVTVSGDASEVEPLKAFVARLTAQAQEGPSTGPAQVAEAQVCVRAQGAENLALKAKATASSAWADGNHQAQLAIDGDASTRWNSREGDKDGCWIELAWEKGVRFDRVVIDECMDFGPRIQAWKLLAGSDELKEIAGGTEMGRRRVVNLPAGVEARRLRLLIEKASTVPTIWEIEVNCIRKK